MATNQVSGGDPQNVLHTAAAAISSGDVVVLASTDAKKCRVGVALVDIASGATGAVAVTGVWRFAKVSAAVIAQGESVNWDSSEEEVDDNAHTSAAGDVVEFGMAVEAAGDAVTSIDIDISEPGTYDAA